MPDAVLVLAPNWLGDAVMALPAIADVRRHFSASRLVVAARRSVASLFHLVDGIDDVQTLEWRGSLLSGAALRGDVGAIRQRAIDLAILLPNSFASAWLTRQAGVAERWGYRGDVRTALLTRGVPRPTASLHQGRYYQHLTAHLGIPSGPLEPKVSAPDAALDAATALLRDAGWDGRRPLVVMAPGAAYGTAKRWLPEHFAQLATSLVTTREASCVLVGSAADQPTTSHVRARVATPQQQQTIDLAGRTSLDALAAILRIAKVCVANDSGTMHLAAAAGVPVVALFGPTREYETAPLAHAGVPADVLVNPVWCRPCMLRECPIDHRCMRGLEPARAFDAVSRMLDRPRHSDGAAS